MKYLITGGSGFIGSHLGERLLSAGHEVIALDDLSTGSTANVTTCSASERFRFVEGSILDRPLVDELVSEADSVVHLAAAVGVRLIMDETLSSFTTNVQGSEIVLDACCRTGTPILVASTSEIYGKNTANSLSELSDRVMGPTSTRRWSYALSKAYDEVMTLLRGEEEGLHVTIARFFNTVGPRQSPAYGMVIPRLAQQAVRGEPITVHGDGLQTRCFCHVSDTTRAVHLLLDADRPTGEIFNIGRPEETSILDLASRIRTAAESESVILTVPYGEVFAAGFEDMRRRVPNVAKIRSAVGWESTIPLDQIVSDAVAQARADTGSNISTS